LRRSGLVSSLGEMLTAVCRRLRRSPATPRILPARPPEPTARKPMGALLSRLSFVVMLVLLAIGCWKLLAILLDVGAHDWARIGWAGTLTLSRVMVSTVLGTLWALPLGLAIGMSPRLSRVLQPVTQVLASFPAPMLFPLVVAALRWLGVSLGYGSIVLMLLGTQWYILFNVIAGAMAIPADLREAARMYRIRGWQAFRVLYGPAVFPYLVTGWATAAGGAWNASIVCEYVISDGKVVSTPGLGSMISYAAAAANFPLLAGSVVAMAFIVVLFNRTVWRTCQLLAEQRFNLSS